MASKDMKKKAFEQFLKGETPDSVAETLKITVAEAEKLQQEFADLVRNFAQDDRIIKRQKWRSLIPKALETLEEAMNGEGDFSKENVLDNPDIASAMLGYMKMRVDAAKAFLTGKSLIEDDLVNMHTERPKSGPAETQYTYESCVNDDGSTTLTVRPKVIQAAPAQLPGK